MAEISDLTYAECRAALELAPVGRVAVCTADGPHIIPVNFTVIDESVVFRTSPLSLLARHLGEQAAFEVDHIDEEHRSGWSVLARGRAVAIENPADLQRIQRLAPVAPWAGGVRTIFGQLTWRTLTGRRVVS